MLTEYDAFGPWIYQIDAEHAVPPQFAPYCDAQNATLMLKIPREIERRRVKPGTPLYDYLVSAEEQQLLILHRAENEIEQCSIAYQDITGLRVTRYFLQGMLWVYTRSKIYQLPFNTVSMDLMMQLIMLLRQNIPHRKTKLHTIPEPFTISQLHPPEVLFVNLLRDLAAQGEKLRAGAFQKCFALHHIKRNPIIALTEHMKRPVQPSALHLLLADELLIIEREQHSANDDKQSYGYNYTYVPLQCICGITCADDTAYTGSRQIDIVLCGDNRISLRLSQQEDQVLQFYRLIAQILQVPF